MTVDLDKELYSVWRSNSRRLAIKALDLIVVEAQAYGQKLEADIDQSEYDEQVVRVTLKLNFALLFETIKKVFDVYAQDEYTVSNLVKASVIDGNVRTFKPNAEAYAKISDDYKQAVKEG